MQKSILCLSLAAFCCQLVLAQPETRAWVDDTGRKVLAVFAGIQGDSVILRLPDGQTVPFPLARLSDEDQKYVKAQAGRVLPVTVPDAPRVPVGKRTWPDTVVVSSRSLEIKPMEEKEAPRQFVYQSEAFEFTSQAKLAGSVMKEVARTFEATRALVEALPWGIVCRPPDGMQRFRAALFETREDYLEAGGPPNSGGVYSSRDRVFMIPFESLGLLKRGQTYFKNDSYSNGTLVHELTHQLMGDYLSFLSTWIVEGTAEYTEMLPYNAGTFRAGAHKSSMKGALQDWRENGVFQGDMGSLEEHMTMTREGWDLACSTPEKMQIMYHRSHLLVYFFNHLDGDGKGLRFMQFMDAVHKEVAAVHAFFADPRVKMQEGGRFSYPRSMTPPDMSEEVAFKHLSILLNGRTYSQLAAEMTQAFEKNLGAKITAQ